MAANAMLANKVMATPSVAVAVAPAPAGASLKASPRVVGFLQGRNQLAGKAKSQASGKRGGKGRVAVRAASKDIFFGQDSRAAMQAGIDKLADSVGVTLGPRGMEHEIGTAEVALSTTIRRFW
jgi:hypothetical protein